MRFMKIIICLAIVAFWVTMMRAVYVREVGGKISPSGPVIRESVTLDAWSEYATAEFRGNELGALGTVIRKRDDGGYTIEHRSLISQSLFGRDIQAALAGEAQLTDELNLTDFYFTTRINNVRYDLTGVVTDDDLSLTVEAVSGVVEQKLKLDSPLQLETGLTPFLVQRPDFKVGQRFGFSAFNPITMKAEEGSIDVVETDRDDADYLLITRFGESTLNNWITADGASVTQTSDLGFDAYGISYESLLAQKRSQKVDLHMSVPIEVLLQEGPTRSLNLRFHGLKEDAYPAVDSRQIAGVRPGEFTFLQGAQPDGLAVPPEDLEMYKRHDGTTGPLLAILSHMPDKAELPWDKALWLLKWIEGHIEVRPTIGAESAVDAYTQRRGDARSITRLYVALARMSGLPARCVSGLVYKRGGFVCHYWPEIWAGGWVGVDPTLRTNTPGPGHVAFFKSLDVSDEAMRAIVQSARIEVLKQEMDDDPDRGPDQAL